jgi:uncharacterized damage-inducible protein DinB
VEGKKVNKIELLLQGWDSCYEKEDWYPPLKDALNGLTIDQANWRPGGEPINSIWETVHHLIFYKERLLKRLTGEEAEYPSGVTNDDTFVGATASEQDWRDTLLRLKAAHQGIRDAVAGWDDEQFERMIPNTVAGRWVFSLITHDAYHTGQIMLIRKLQGSWPSRRSFE